MTLAEIDIIHSAAESSGLVRFGYEKGGKVTERLLALEPGALRSGCLVGYDLDRRGVRSFSVERMRDLRVATWTDSPARIDAAIADRAVGLAADVLCALQAVVVEFHTDHGGTLDTLADCEEDERCKAWGEAYDSYVARHRALREGAAETCHACGQGGGAKGGEYPCKACGRPLVHDPADAVVETEEPASDHQPGDEVEHVDHPHWGVGRVVQAAQAGLVRVEWPPLDPGSISPTLHQPEKLRVVRR